jgi:hypothetical protein
MAPAGSSYTGSGSASTSMQLTPYGISVPGSAVQAGGGGGVPEPFFRNTADEQRSMYRQAPQAQYPDGYLGTIVSRQNDRLMQALQARTSQPNYTRGVHKGARISAGDYFWPPEFNEMSGLKAEAAGRRQAPIGAAFEVDMHEAAIPSSGVHNPATLDRNAALRRLMPSTRW